MTNVFWRDFVKVAAAIRRQVQEGKLRLAFDNVESLLSTHGYHFAFEITEDWPDVVLALTPEGDPVAAKSIDNLVAYHPRIDGWKIYTRRQRKHLKDAVAFVLEIYGWDTIDARFEVDNYQGRYSLTLVSHAIADLTPEVISGLSATLLDHLLGEEFVMTHISAIHARTEPSHPSTMLVSMQDLYSRLEVT